MTQWIGNFTPGTPEEIWNTVWIHRVAKITEVLTKQTHLNENLKELKEWDIPEFEKEKIVIKFECKELKVNA